ncbi:hypothetical protein ACFL3V_00115 [Nanoarchaeota archaeon]
MTERPLYESFEAHLRHLDETGQRRRAEMGSFKDPDYNRYVDDTLHGYQHMSPERRARMLTEVIEDAFHMGYEISDYLEQLRKFCEENNVTDRILKRKSGKASQ